jgi:ATP-dependent Lon protease
VSPDESEPQFTGPEPETPADDRDAASAPHSELIIAREVLPGALHLLPLSHRPYFPGQGIPLIIDERWQPTIDAVTATEHKVVGLVLVKTEDSESASVDDFHRMGTACRIHRVHRDDAGHIQVLLEGLQRFSIADWLRREAPFVARITYHPETRYEHVKEVKAYAVAIINTIKELLPLNPLYGEELKYFMQHFTPNEPSRLADFAASLTTAHKGELQDVLETTRILSRLEKVLTLINKELGVARSQMEIRRQVESEIQGRQRELFLRETLKAIQKELGLSKDDRTAELERFRSRIEALDLPAHARERIDEEMGKLALLETGSPEFGVTRNYLDWLTSLPWGVHTKDELDLARARKVLDEGHDALEDVKERILEFLAVGRLRGEVAGSILLFVGPPGVGKTSLGRSIAAALGRRFYRFSLGGMRDEAEIKGHRRTYIGAMPGKFIQAVRESGSSNPVIMLDEVDKIGASYQGDPASALLEVLDPEQNSQFLDHYLDVRFDLSKVLFVCTANQLDTIPPPLLDRMETIRLAGYLAQEKLAIARRHLLRRQIEKAGLTRAQLRVEDAALRAIIEDYDREAGVRGLEKQIGRIVRRAAVAILNGEPTPIVVRRRDLARYLGPPVFRKQALERGVGIATGLAWTPLGGATLVVEATRVHEAARGFQLTGQLGGVMKESAEIAYSYVAANAARFGAAPQFFANASIHLHVPEGATPKDGPSAGITMASALLSLARARPIVRRVAMTGELTLTGQVLPVGGIREKIVATRRARIKEVILPAANRGDYDQLPAHVREGLNAHFVSHYPDVAALLW